MAHPLEGRRPRVRFDRRLAEPREDELELEDEREDLNVESSPSFVRQPEGDECVERFIRTLKQRLLWMHWFRTVEALNPTLRDFRCRCNGHWIIGRIDDRTATTRQRILFGNAA